MIGSKAKCGVCGGATVYLPKTRWATTQEAYDVSSAWVRNPKGGELTLRARGKAAP